MRKVLSFRFFFYQTKRQKKTKEIENCQGEIVTWERPQIEIIQK